VGLQGYGVIRDVLQNHLTQIMVLLKMDLPHDDPNNVFGGNRQRTVALQNVRFDVEDGATHKGRVAFRE
jgi:glucose-6-phosphate 1-dehydrogenase